MAKLLEVIVTSVEDAIEAEAGGADRLELVRELAVGGLTPESALVESVLKAVKIPVRAMIRQTSSMQAKLPAEIAKLRSDAASMARKPLDGLVAGFADEQAIDKAALEAVLAAAPGSRLTFHRAFDEMRDPLAAIDALKALGRVDRILTAGGNGGWPERKQRLITWQRAARPSITILVGGGTCWNVLQDLAETPQLEEVHIGRAARTRQSVEGPVKRELVRSLRNMFS
jgi:copper homeostasis protein